LRVRTTEVTFEVPLAADDDVQSDCRPRNATLIPFVMAVAGMKSGMYASSRQTANKHNA